MARGGWGMGGVAPRPFVRAARIGLIIRLDILYSESIIQYMDAATRRAAHIT